MTKPTSFDVDSTSKNPAMKQYMFSQNETHNDWCYASINEVKQNCIDSGLDIDSFKLYDKDELSEGILYASIQEQIDNVDDHIETISDLTPNETNELYHKRLLTNLEVMQDGLKGFEKWISDSGTLEDRFDAAIEYVGV